ncbi:hypothetical protein R6Q59_034999 [Mikania micrantha]
MLAAQRPNVAQDESERQKSKAHKMKNKESILKGALDHKFQIETSLASLEQKRKEAISQINTSSSGVTRYVFWIRHRGQQATRPPNTTVLGGLCRCRTVREVSEDAHWPSEGHQL